MDHAAAIPVELLKSCKRMDDAETALVARLEETSTHVERSDAKPTRYLLPMAAAAVTSVLPSRDPSAVPAKNQPAASTPLLLVQELASLA